MGKRAEIALVMRWQETFADEDERDERSYKPRFREARLENGYTQNDVADILGVASITVYKWEHGEKAPRLPQLIRLSKLYSKTIDYLVGM